MIVTVEADHAPPRIRIDTTAAAVTRTAGGVTTPVRGLVVGGTIYDYEAPQETSLVYNDGLTTSAPVELPALGVWLVHLTQPDLSRQIEITAHPEWVHAANQAGVSIPGRARPIVVSFGPRSDVTTSFTVRTETGDDEAALLALLADQSILFVSTHDGHGLGPAYLSVGDVRWSRMINYCGNTVRYVELPVVAVDRPMFVVDAGLAWSDLPATWPALAMSWDSLVKA